MKELILTTLYWVVNLIILLAAFVYAVQVWEEKRRAVYGVLLFIGGFLWHVIRGLYSYHYETCEQYSQHDNWLVIANRCIPSDSFDIISAQIAIFSGMFVIIAVIFKRYSKNEANQGS